MKIRRGILGPKGGGGVFEAKSLRFLPEDLQESKNLSEIFASKR
jgi:hypothetical protein